MKVESKYKNPDKYIEILKKENEEAWRSYRKLGERLGEYWFCYRDGITVTAVLDLEDVKKCCIKGKVILQGEIIKLEAGCNKITTTIELSEVCLGDGND